MPWSSTGTPTTRSPWLLQQRYHRRIAWFLHGNGGAGIGQDPSDQVDGVPGSGGDDGVLRRRYDAAGAGDPVREGGAELRRPARVVVVPRGAVQGAYDAAAPGGDREQGGVEVARAEVERTLGGGVESVRGDAGRAPGRLQGGDPGPGADLQRRRAHPGAAAGPSFDVALGAEAAVGLGDGRARDVQVGGHDPGRGEPVTGRQPALDDGGAQLFVQLDLLRPGIVGIEEELHVRLIPQTHLV